MIGKKFGRLLVLEESGKTSDGRPAWKCKCDCGNSGIYCGKYLRTGHTKSCGCFRIDNTRQIKTTHGVTKTRFYRIWASVKQRCEDSGSKNFEKYGKKGIRVLWTSFESFRNDMYEAYENHVEKFGEKNTQIDRINYLGNYELSNCRWVNLFEQAQNKSNNINIYFQGETRCLKDWSRKLNKNYLTLYTRLFRRKWPIEKALTK